MFAYLHHFFSLLYFRVWTPILAIGDEWKNITFTDVGGVGESAFNKLAGAILTIAQFIGAILCIWGLVNIAFSIKNEDAEGKQRAVLMFFGGLCMASLRSILTAMGFG